MKESESGKGRARDTGQLVLARTTLRVQGDSPDLEEEEDGKEDANHSADKNERGRRKHLQTGAASRSYLRAQGSEPPHTTRHGPTRPGMELRCRCVLVLCHYSMKRNFGSALRLCYTAAFCIVTVRNAAHGESRSSPAQASRRSPCCRQGGQEGQGDSGSAPPAGHSRSAGSCLHRDQHQHAAAAAQPARAATRERGGRISPTGKPSAYTGEDCAAAHTSRHKAAAASCRCHGRAQRQGHSSAC